MSGLIERITNRDLVAGLRSDLAESDRAVHSLQDQLDDFYILRERADTLVDVVNVLKMRLNLLAPETTEETILRPGKMERNASVN